MKKIALFAAASMLSLSGALAGSMRAFDAEFPSFSGAAPTARAAVQRDGLGRRIKPKTHPKHNARRQFERDFSDFKKRVEATHSDREDPRDDKYLHSHARQFRGLRRALAMRQGAAA